MKKVLSLVLTLLLSFTFNITAMADDIAEKIAVLGETELLETTMHKIEITDAESGIKYSHMSEASGKRVKITVPVAFVNEDADSVSAILAIYNRKRILVDAKAQEVLTSDTKIVFEVTLPSDTASLKVMCWDSLSGMKPVCEAVSETDVDLDGKKIIFIGNSHVYRGLTVVEKSNSVLTQKSRSNDTGYFYQLCKANGFDVEVTNWTFPSHGTYNLFNTKCPVSGSCKGKKHEEYLTDKYFDYVFINSATTTRENAGELLIDNVDYIMDFFKSANPNAKFILLGNASSHGLNKNNTPYSAVTNSYKAIAEKGVIIADWGRVVKGIVKGEYDVPNAKYDYVKSSFVVSDQYHPNALAGYLTTLTAYCAITGESAVGQPYSFYNDTTLNSKFNMSTYLNKYYTNGASDTNSDEIFTSESDMLGLQQLVDKWFADKPYLNE